MLDLSPVQIRRLMFTLAAQLLVATVAMANCNDDHHYPCGAWLESCRGCGFDGSTFSCPATGDATRRSDTDYIGCLDDEDEPRKTSIDLSTCPTCELDNFDGQLGCGAVHIDLGVVPANIEGPPDWQYTLQESSTRETDPNQYALATTGEGAQISLWPGQKAYITYQAPEGYAISAYFCDLNQDCASCTGPSGISRAQLTQLPGLSVSTTRVGDQYSLTVHDLGRAGHTYRFHLQLTPTTAGSTAKGICSPDPTIVNKSEDGSNPPDGDHKRSRIGSNQAKPNHRG